MPIYDYLCPLGHLFDGLYRYQETLVPCRLCSKRDSIDSFFHHVPSSWQNYLLSTLTDLNNGHVVPPRHALRVLLSAPSWKVSNAQAFAPIVIHRNQEGKIRFPANSTATLPEGFVRQELRTIPEALRFEKTYRAQQDASRAELVARDEASFTRSRAINRQPLLDRIPTMSEKGREFAIAAMAGRDRKIAEQASIGKRSTDFRIEILHDDQSNREPHADARTDWKDKKA